MDVWAWDGDEPMLWDELLLTQQVELITFQVEEKQIEWQAAGTWQQSAV